MIDANIKEIRAVVSENATYMVPEYQRPFAWKTTHAEEFWEDLSSGPTFLGTFVFNQSERKSREISVVDGQQRLTTIFILMSACLHHLRTINSNTIADNILSKMSFVDDTTGKSTGSKLIVSESIRDAFTATIVNGSWDGKDFDVKNKMRQVAKVKPIYEYFQKKIKTYSETEMSALLSNIYSCTVVQIDIDDLQEAFDIFERTNARGLELNTADLLKNYILSTYDALPENKEEILNRWTSIIENSNTNIQRMLKYFYASEHGTSTRKELFRNLKTYAGTIGPQNFLKRLHEFSELYNLVLTSTKDSILTWASTNQLDFFSKEYEAESLNRSYEALRLFGIVTAYPVVIKLKAFLSSVAGNEKKLTLSKSYAKLILALEKFHFANYAVCQRPGNEIEKYFADQSNTKITEDNYCNFVDLLCSSLRKEKLVKKNEFDERFCELNYESNFRLIYYINDRLNNLRLKGGQYKQIFHSDKRIMVSNFDIEHLFAQDDTNYGFDFDTIQESIHNIGNLIVISKHTNGALGNVELSKKLPFIKEKENLSEATELYKLWSTIDYSTKEKVREEIVLRAKSVSTRAYAYASSFS